MDTPSSSIGPGLGAFIAFFVLAIALWLLMRNMNGRMRRMAYREQQRVAELEAKQAERKAAKTPEKRTEAPPQDTDDKADPAP
jgi:cytidylate kinase